MIKYYFSFFTAFMAVLPAKADGIPTHKCSATAMVAGRELKVENKEVYLGEKLKNSPAEISFATSNPGIALVVEVDPLASSREVPYEGIHLVLTIREYSTGGALLKVYGASEAQYAGLSPEIVSFGLNSLNDDYYGHVLCVRK